MVEKGSIRLTGFGTLSVRERAERGARNPQNGAPVTVPAHNDVKFKPGAALLRYVNGEPVPGRSLLSRRPRS